MSVVAHKWFFVVALWFSKRAVALFWQIGPEIQDGRETGMSCTEVCSQFGTYCNQSALNNLTGMPMDYWGEKFALAGYTCSADSPLPECEEFGDCDEQGSPYIEGDNAFLHGACRAGSIPSVSPCNVAGHPQVRRLCPCDGDESLRQGHCVQYAKCSCWGDPHCIPYDLNNFGFMDTGLFRYAASADASFEVQGFNCPYRQASVIAAIAVRASGSLVTIINGALAVDGIPVTGSTHPIGLSIDGGRVTLNTKDACPTHLLAVRRTARESPFHFNNIAIDIPAENVSLDGVCGSVGGRGLLPVSESLFDSTELQQLYTICPSAQQSPPVAHFLNSRRMSQRAPPATPQEACDLAGIPFENASSLCAEVQAHADYYGPCIYDYCASGADEAFIANAVSTQQTEIQRSRLYPRAPASALPATPPADEDTATCVSAHVGLLGAALLGMQAFVLSE